jgi:hypothetical protein
MGEYDLPPKKTLKNLPACPVSCLSLEDSELEALPALRSLITFHAKSIATAINMSKVNV